MVKIANVNVIQGLNGWLLLDFDNGERKIVDLRPIMKGVLEPLRENEFFEQVSIDPELGTVTWPGELDLDPDNLYKQGIDVEGFDIKE